MTDTNYAVAPGEYLQEWMDEIGLNTADVASLMVIESGRVDRILSGTEELTSYLTQQLHFVTGIPQRVWERYEGLYRSDLARIAAFGPLVAAPATEEGKP